MMTFLVFVGPKVGSVEWVIAQTGVGARVSADIQQYMVGIIDQDAQHRRQLYCYDNPVRGWMMRYDGLLSAVMIFFVLIGLLYLIANPDLFNITNVAFTFSGFLVSMLVFMVFSVTWKDLLCKPYVSAERSWEREEVDYYHSDEFTKLRKELGMKVYKHTHASMLNRPLFSVVGEGDAGHIVEYIMCSRS